MSHTSGLPASFFIIDRLLTLQSALHSNAAASAFVERALLLHRLGFSEFALVDARRAHLLDPSDPQAMALCCRLGALQSGCGVHDIAVALLDSPFANEAERRQSLSAIDLAQLPLMRRLELALTLRLTLVGRKGDSITLEGTGPDDWITPLGQVGAQNLVAFDCHALRPARGSRQLAVVTDGVKQTITVEAVKRPPPPFAPEGRPRAPLWIILPLKDGGAVLELCLKSVLDNLLRLHGARLVLVDDGSELPETQQLLTECLRKPRVCVTRTTGNLGYTGAINHGLQQIGPGHVLLLNSDTWLPRETLPRLLAHLDDPTVGTVTPLSNNAGSVSLLGPGRATAMPDPVICQQLSATAFRYNRGLAIDLPNGNGFAMLISESCMSAIGQLSQHYDSGYYEEVDFCLRASQRGWRHVAATDCFVGHVGSMTYGARKHQLASANHRRLVRRFPHYPALYKKFAALDPLAEPRAQLLEALAHVWQPEVRTETQPHISVAQIVLPPPPIGPFVLPLRGTVSMELRSHRFRRLRLVPEPMLTACGLQLLSAHDLLLETDEIQGLLLVLTRETRKPLASFSYVGASNSDFAEFEIVLLDILGRMHETKKDHAIFV